MDMQDNFSFRRKRADEGHILRAVLHVNDIASLLREIYSNLAAEGRKQQIGRGYRRGYLYEARQTFASSEQEPILSRRRKKPIVSAFINPGFRTSLLVFDAVDQDLTRFSKRRSDCVDASSHRPVIWRQELRRWVGYKGYLHSQALGLIYADPRF